MKKWMLLVFVSCLLIVLAGCGSNQNEEAEKDHLNYKKGVTVTTKYGKVKGYKDKNESVLVWKGVPYAKAPVKELRWKKPESPEKYDGTLDATKDKEVFIQTAQDGVTGSEESLHMNIYRPDTSEKKLPVMVYIHGGNNQGGSATEIGGEAFVKDLNTIFISVDYRLGALGFNPLKALNTGDKLEDSGNYALLDMAKSLDWVKENIEAFGGDPDNITFSGFSAGGRDVMASLTSPIFKDKYQKAIAFSGGMTVADPDDSIKVFAKAIAPLVVEDGVKATEEEAYTWLQENNKEVSDYLYGVSAERLSKLMGNASIRMSAFPHLYTDGAVIPKNGFDTKNYNNVPLIMLSGTSEFSFFAMGDPYFAESFASGAIPKNKEKLAEFQFAKQYGSDFYTLFNTELSAKKMEQHYDAPIYNTKMPFGTNLKTTTDMSLVGAYHGVFIPFLDSNNQTYLSTITESYQLPGAEELQEKFRAYLKNFLHDGDPNGDNLTKWTTWSADNPSNLILDADDNQAQIKMEKETDTNQAIIDRIEADTSISETAKNQIVHQVLNSRWFSDDLDAYYSNPSLWPN
ncbi:carboxylesterase family protein [Listeria sp. FSL L7-1509]|uniref:Carboxylesterase family protein n=1 Tax=Listeria immobilis TaxID=2713502 RepID=A0ABR6SUF1_9LIST|nr:carboxylesterase family protein [Listeria immobilis]MBC1483441.1 carboxylesterase family protein [Listeria immobilis]MBC1506404.1 carboxylesterase family protein [Listeria immobilis]MBC1509311.1 carboxylesterase family protein [Listeria immobilis]MBC6303184.1 carboxylesterase family protein [Listeria immobilis]MBC6311743.1 carboxylesterase family protein [Listeria immobilis]